jgi:hypothetical protein
MQIFQPIKKHLEIKAKRNKKDTQEMRKLYNHVYIRSFGTRKDGKSHYYDPLKWHGCSTFSNGVSVSETRISKYQKDLQLKYSEFQYST